MAKDTGQMESEEILMEAVFLAGMLLLMWLLYADYLFHKMWGLI